MEAHIPEDPKASFVPEGNWWIPPNGLSTRWLSEREVKATLRRIARDWQAFHSAQALDTLGLIRWEVWEAECGLAPFPEIAVASRGQQALGVLCGHGNTAQRYFFLNHLAVLPGTDEADHDLVCRALLAAAIDRSIDLGWHGWVACEPTSDDERLWRQLGFYKHDEFTFRRMGYFQ
jgi:hypothetical protein